MTTLDLVAAHGNAAIALHYRPNPRQPTLVVVRNTVLHRVATCHDEMAARRLWWALKQITDTTGASR